MNRGSSPALGSPGHCSRCMVAWPLLTPKNAQQNQATTLMVSSQDSDALLVRQAMAIVQGHALWRCGIGRSGGTKSVFVHLELIISGWWYTYPSEQNISVNWDDKIPNLWENNPVVFQSPTRYLSSDSQLFRCLLAVPRQKSSLKRTLYRNINDTVFTE